MQYIVSLWRKPGSKQAVMRDTARDADPVRAIKSSLRGRNIKSAHLICAYPANKKGRITKVWCEEPHCGVSGRVTFQRIYTEDIEE